MTGAGSMESMENMCADVPARPGKGPAGICATCDEAATRSCSGGVLLCGTACYDTHYQVCGVCRSRGPPGGQSHAAPSGVQPHLMDVQEVAMPRDDTDEIFGKIGKGGSAMVYGRASGSVVKVFKNVPFSFDAQDTDLGTNKFTTMMSEIAMARAMASVEVLPSSYGGTGQQSGERFVAPKVHGARIVRVDAYPTTFAPINGHRAPASQALGGLTMARAGDTLGKLLLDVTAEQKRFLLAVTAVGNRDYGPAVSLGFETAADYAMSALEHTFDTLAAMHDSGAFHGDLNQGNAVLAKDGGAVVLIDFGFSGLASITPERIELAGGKVGLSTKAVTLAWRELNPTEAVTNMAWEEGPSITTDDVKFALAAWTSGRVYDATSNAPDPSRHSSEAAGDLYHYAMRKTEEAVGTKTLAAMQFIVSNGAVEDVLSPNPNANVSPPPPYDDFVAAAIAGLRQTRAYALRGEIITHYVSDELEASMDAMRPPGLMGVAWQFVRALKKELKYAKDNPDAHSRLEGLNDEYLPQALYYMDTVRNYRGAGAVGWHVVVDAVALWAVTVRMTSLMSILKVPTLPANANKPGGPRVSQRNINKVHAHQLVMKLNEKIQEVASKRLIQAVVNGMGVSKVDHSTIRDVDGVSRRFILANAIIDNTRNNDFTTDVDTDETRELLAYILGLSD